jgi:hypothetical protein
MAAADVSKMSDEEQLAYAIRMSEKESMEGVEMAVEDEQRRIDEAMAGSANQSDDVVLLSLSPNVSKKRKNVIDDDFEDEQKLVTTKKMKSANNNNSTNSNRPTFDLTEVSTEDDLPWENGDNSKPHDTDLISISNEEAIGLARRQVRQGAAMLHVSDDELDNLLAPSADNRTMDEDEPKPDDKMEQSEKKMDVGSGKPEKKVEKPKTNYSHINIDNIFLGELDNYRKSSGPVANKFKYAYLFVFVCLFAF